MEWCDPLDESIVEDVLALVLPSLPRLGDLLLGGWWSRPEDDIWVTIMFKELRLLDRREELLDPSMAEDRLDRRDELLDPSMVEIQFLLWLDLDLPLLASCLAKEDLGERLRRRTDSKAPLQDQLRRMPPLLLSMPLLLSRVDRGDLLRVRRFSKALAIQLAFLLLLLLLLSKEE